MISSAKVFGNVALTGDTETNKQTLPIEQKLVVKSQLAKD